MKQKIFSTAFIILSLFTFDCLHTQNINLKIFSVDKSEVSILNKIQYQKKHTDSLSINAEINNVSKYLKNIGYFSNTIDSIIKVKNNFLVYYSLNQKIDSCNIYVNLKDQYLFKDFEIKHNTISIPTEKLQTTLLYVSKKIDLEGKSFSKIKLKNIKINNKKLFADLSIESSTKRIINKVIVKGYDDFPKSFLKNHFKITSKTIFNENNIQSISEATKNLQFVSEIKSPEVLFTKDSTFLYIYLKRRKNNSFDGLVNFATKENGDFLLNGHIDLTLKNILNEGEKFKIYWNKIADERQEFEIAIEKPYVFNSKITPELSFSIYKQDSSFLNTKFDSKIFYHINSKIKIALTYNAESSENLSGSINTNVETFHNYFLGFKFKYSVPKNDFFFNEIFNLEVNPTFGERKIKQKASKQFKIEGKVSYLWDLNFRNSLFIQNQTSYLNSDSFLNNELFRIGGANSIRGFDEQSIFTNNYSFFNIEYRFLTSQKSYLYSITDVGFIENKTKIDNILGIGLGYLFATKNSLIKLSTVVGKNSSQSFNLNNSKLIVSWVSFF